MRTPRGILVIVVWMSVFSTGCSQGTGMIHTRADPMLGLDRVGYVFVARHPDFLSEKTKIDVWLNGGPVASIAPDQFAVARAHGALNELKVTASGFLASFYPSEIYKFSRAGRNNHYFLVAFEHRLTYDRLILQQVDRATWLDQIGQPALVYR